MKIMFFADSKKIRIPKIAVLMDDNKYFGH